MTDKTVTITVDEDGEIKFLVDEHSKPFITPETVVKRASHVEPANPLLRVMFHGLRSVCSRQSSLAEFTRMWPCDWRINLAPIGGPILPGTYEDRQDAIDEEVRFLNDTFV